MHQSRLLDGSCRFTAVVGKHFWQGILDMSGPFIIKLEIVNYS